MAGGNDELGAGLPKLEAGRWAFAAPLPRCPQGTPLRLFWQVVGCQWAIRGRPANLKLGTSPRAGFPTPHNWHILETNGSVRVPIWEPRLAPPWMYEGTYSLETQDRRRALLLTSGLISADGQLRPLKT